MTRRTSASGGPPESPTSHQQVFVSVLAYQPGRPNSNDQLWQDLSNALSNYSLTATTGWGMRDVADAIADQADSSDRVT
jgi:hypothetical protein